MIERLTKEQEAQLGEYTRRGIEKGLNTDPVTQERDAMNSKKWKVIK